MPGMGFRLHPSSSTATVPQSRATRFLQLCAGLVRRAEPIALRTVVQAPQRCVIDAFASRNRSWTLPILVRSSLISYAKQLAGEGALLLTLPASPKRF